ncbi:MAG: hypothetical protein ACE5I5_15870 [Candidatus Heimdallarchaeota archaeon]
MSEIRVRCYACGNRFTVRSDQEEAKCPHCGKKWRVTLLAPDQAQLFSK